LHFDAASASRFLRVAHLPASHADHEPLSADTSLCAFGPTAYADRRTPFLAPFRRRPTGFTLPAGGPAPRVWLPFQRPRFPGPWKPFSAPNAHGLHPSELFSGLAIENRFPGPLPLSRFSTRPFGLVPSSCSPQACGLLSTRPESLFACCPTCGAGYQTTLRTSRR
jgi:hypothetical protein